MDIGWTSGCLNIRPPFNPYFDISIPAYIPLAAFEGLLLLVPPTNVVSVQILTLFDESRPCCIGFHDFGVDTM